MLLILVHTLGKVEYGSVDQGCYGQDVLSCIVFQNDVFALLSDAKAHKG